MVNSSTPWTLRTTKRKYPTSAPNPRERRRTCQNVEDGLCSLRRRPRQQTLTQIQFVPRRSQDERDEAVELHTSAKKRAEISQDRGKIQKRNSTLTQMDFLAISAFHDDDDDDDHGGKLTPLQDNGDIQDGERTIMQLDGSGDPQNPKRQRGTPSNRISKSKRKDTPVISQESQDFRPPQKKRKTNGEAAMDNLEHRRRTSSRAASVRAARSTGLLSARYGEDHDDVSELFETPSIPSRAAAPHERDSLARLQEPSLPARDQESQSLLQHKMPRASYPRTPSKKKDVIPSSQSPDSLPSSTQRTNGLDAGNHVMSQKRSPLKERPVNIQVTRRRRDCKESSLDPLQRPPSRRKICVLKYPTHELQQERTPVENAKAVPQSLMWSLSCSSPRLGKSERPLFIPIIEARDSNENWEPKEPNMQPFQSLMLEFKDSDEEDEIEIPGANPLSRKQAPVLSPDTVEIQGVSSIDELLRLRVAQEEATSLQGTGKENNPGDSKVVLKVLEMDDAKCRVPQLSKTGRNHDEPRSVESPGAAAYVADPDEGDGSVLALSPGLSIANSTQFNAEMAERISPSSVDASPSPSTTSSRRKSFSSPQPNHEVELSLPRPKLVHQPSAYSITTKSVPLNDTSPSPSISLPSNQYIVAPAPLPRPSQISTQDATQPYPILSSMPLAPMSSPTGSRLATITIKDSSSAPRPLRNIPWERYSQSQPQSPLNIGFGLLNDCLDDEDDEKLSKDLAAISDQAEFAINEQESQVVPRPLQTSRTRGKGEVRYRATEKGSPVRERRPRKPVIPPEVMAVLGESFLESVPGPPGWSQRSWDDEPL